MHFGLTRRRVAFWSDIVRLRQKMPAALHQHTMPKT